MNISTKLEPIIKTLKVQIPTPEKLTPYGEVLGYHPETEPMPLDFYDGALTWPRLVKLHVPSTRNKTVLREHVS